MQEYVRVASHGGLDGLGLGFSTALSHRRGLYKSGILEANLIALVPAR